MMDESRGHKITFSEHDEASRNDEEMRMQMLADEAQTSIIEGAWPESESCIDDELGPIPSKWRGICQNDSDQTFQCNRKLIGARYFNKGYTTLAGFLNSSFNTPRDTNGHGSHTLFKYQVFSDILAAFDMEIDDGVEVLSVSLGGDAGAYVNDSIAIGSFHVVKHGIVIVTSADNSSPGTVLNVAPWLITVSASTIHCQFPSYIILGNKKQYKRESLSVETLPKGKFFPIINAASAKAPHASTDDARLCKAGELDPKKVKGNILVYLRGDNARVDKGQQPVLAGAVGMVLANDYASGDEIIIDPHVLPATQISYTDGLELFAYVNSTSTLTTSITHPTTQLGTKPAPVMAAFSSI
ncbi:subtilisin-like protease sbt5.3 [Nicotiana attenuata]|uniref:Subtilisin-like protease sbt5.3 n=1 Tax=Nicotiana attenuata TaxID=49451 RepID=A0A1J6IU14_NICAT|nr:subtilisin-like protease sbt5.3 [Nicotiana attenuata]